MYQESALAFRDLLPDHCQYEGDSSPPVRQRGRHETESAVTETDGAEPTETSEQTFQRIAFAVVAAFRRHPHVNNVLTHISGSNWHNVERALRAIICPLTQASNLSPLAENILILICAERGVTGRILKPYFRDVLQAILPPRQAERLTARVTRLFEEFGAWRLQAKLDSRSPRGQTAK